MIQRDIEYSGQFSKDVKLAQKRHKDMNKLKYLMTLLINNTLPLPAVYKTTRCKVHGKVIAMLMSNRTGS